LGCREGLLLPGGDLARLPASLLFMGEDFGQMNVSARRPNLQWLRRRALGQLKA